MCFFGYRLDKYLKKLLLRQEIFYERIFHATFPGVDRKNLNISLLPKIVYLLLWLSVSALVQGLGHGIKILVLVLFVVTIDTVVSVLFEVPSIFSVPFEYAIGIIIAISIVYVVIETYYGDFTKIFTMTITAFSGAFIAIFSLLYAEDSSYFPLTKEFVEHHFTHNIIFLCIALSLLGLFIQYKQDKEGVPYERSEDDDWFEF